MASSNMHFDYKKSFYLLGTCIAIVFIMSVGKIILFPIALAALIAFMLLPLAEWLERMGMNRTISTVVTVTAMSLLLAGAVFTFSMFTVDAMSSLNRFQNDLSTFFSKSLVWLNEYVPLFPDMTEEEALTKMEDKFLAYSGEMISLSVSSIGTMLSGAVTTVIFIFFLLLYRHGLVQSMAAFAEKEHRQETIGIFKDIQKVGQQYLIGMVKLILLLGTLNSIGLLLIGVKNPFLFGFMAAGLSIIPYVGTTIGAIIPVLFTFISQDASWMPWAVMGWFGFVQFLEGNFLSPVIVGKSVNLNAMFAFMSLIIGGAIWGVGGMVIFLPYIAMLKVASTRFEKLEPLSHLLSEKPYGNFEEEGPSLLDRIKSLVGKKD